MKKKLNEIVSKMTLEEKAGQCSGVNFWETKSIDRLGIPSVMLTDGPHGLRKQKTGADHIGIIESVPSTCFPTASLSSCSFDRELLEKLGEAMAEEALQENVAVILGPGANIKRSPLCGRNFEYISEDPYLTGELAAAVINGIQSKNVGTSLKHFAVNNQEKSRMICDSIVDERALREIYLAGFETAVKKSKPQTVMCSYNKLNGTYLSENKRLLTDILRKEWGYDGVVVTDWGACNDRVKGLKAGLDLEMPFSGGENDKKLVKAVRSGKLDERYLDRAARRMLKLIEKTKQNPIDYKYDVIKHNDIARLIASESAVLLKNDGILPANTSQRVAVVGAFAKHPRYQGGGSSHIKPTMLCSAYDEFLNSNINFTYADGYSLTNDEPDEALIEEAKKAAANRDIVFLYAGLPDSLESEGFDRSHLMLPPSHTTLIEEISKVNPNIVVVLHCGSAIEMPWLDSVKAVLLMYLSGQAGGAASVDLLLGRKSPSGKLTETFPLSIADIPAYNYFGAARSVEYRESIYVGYRYYDKANKEVLFPFGHGLSYTTFEYSDLTLSADNILDSDGLSVTFNVKNTGDIDGKEVVQLYVKPPESKIYKAVRELRAFDCIRLKAGESKTVTLNIDKRAFAYYNVNYSDWHVESGAYGIEIGASSRDIRLNGEVSVTTNDHSLSVPDYSTQAPTYYNLPLGSFEIPVSEFLGVYDGELPDYSAISNIATLNSTLSELQDRALGRLLYKAIQNHMKKMAGSSSDLSTLGPGTEQLIKSALSESPLRTFVLMSQGAMSFELMDAIISALNGKYSSGIIKLIKSIEYYANKK